MSNVYSVTQVNSYIKNMFTQDFMLNRISVKGEVSNCKYLRTGHIYFTLKDHAASLSCVMFAGMRKGLGFLMKDGDQVVVSGMIDVFERDGRYQLYAKNITLDGAGLLYEKFLALKNELEEMGMFAKDYKQPIPAYVKKLGIVTAPTGAAIQDIRNISYRRNPYIQLVLYPSLVQGPEAAANIAEGIEVLDGLGLDAIIVGRGGGSIEDLWAFNEEIVARAIFNCKTPIISAVGHETDTTIADFVADLRAPTPSAAAELAVADIRGILNQLQQYERRLNLLCQDHIDAKRSKIEDYKRLMKHISPSNKLSEKKEYIKEQKDKLQSLMLRKIECNQHDLERRQAGIQHLAENSLLRKRHELSLRIQKLKGLSPLDRLNQGFSYVEDLSGSAVTEVSQVQEGDSLKIQVSDGCISSIVTGKQERDRI